MYKFCSIGQVHPEKILRKIFSPSGFSCESLSWLINDVWKRSRWGGRHAMYFPPSTLILVLSFQQQRKSILHSGLYSLSNEKEMFTFVKRKDIFLALNSKIILFFQIERILTSMKVILNNDLMIFFQQMYRYMPFTNISTLDNPRAYQKKRSLSYFL